MKSIILITSLIITVFSNFNQNPEVLVGKTFRTQIGTMCEEVDGDDSCAGNTIFLLLKFEKEIVIAQEQYISGCGETSLIPIGKYNWSLSKNNIVLENTENTFLENLEITLTDTILSGKRENDGDNLVSRYIFKNILKI